MINHWEINVSLNGKHLFATHERSARDVRDKDRIVEVFRNKFPKEEGYQIRVIAVSIKMSSEVIE